MKSLSLGTILGVAFIILKLIGKISWKWVWVIAPFWIGAIVSIIVVVLYTVFMALRS